MHEVPVNRLGGLVLPRKSVVRLTDRPDVTLDVSRGRKTTMQQQQQIQTRSDLPIMCHEHIKQAKFSALTGLSQIGILFQKIALLFSPLIFQH